MCPFTLNAFYDAGFEQKINIHIKPVVVPEVGKDPRVILQIRVLLATEREINRYFHNP